MIVTPIAHGLDLLKSDLIRSPGVHASDIFGDLFKKLEPKRYDYDAMRKEGEADNPLLMVLGTAWEKHFEHLLILNGVKAYRPEELMSPEGIAYSPDLMLFNGKIRLGDIKLTSMGLNDLPTTVSNYLPPKFSKYLCQVMLYAYWMELVDAWLAILSIRKPWNPELRVLDLNFTDRELKDNHRMCINHGIDIGLIT